MNIAVQLEKILLGNERVVFKPIGLIKGFYDSEEELFIDEYGYEYDKMGGATIYGERYFYAPTTIQELREAYGINDNDTWVVEDFLDSYMEVCYIGYQDYVENVTKLIENIYLEQGLEQGEAIIKANFMMSSISGIMAHQILKGEPLSKHGEYQKILLSI